MQDSTNILIIGAGMVGLSAAVALAQQGMAVTLVDRQSAPQFDFTAQALRVSALSPKTQQFFNQLGVWQAIEQVAPFTKMQVFEAATNAAIHFNADEIHAQALGYILENRRVIKSLWDQINTLAITQYLGETITALSLTEKLAEVTLSNGTILKADCVIGADGAHTIVRQLADIAVFEQPYAHHALVATVRTEKPHAATAWQRFINDAPLAFLPLCDPHQCSIVYSADPTLIKALLSQSEAEFNKSIEEAFAGQLGQIELISERASFPLIKRHAKSYAKQRVVLVGDAAHTVHPLAGQGANLGFADVEALVEVITQARNKGRDIGMADTLGRYARARRGANTQMLQTMDLLQWVYGWRHPALQTLRGLGLRLVDNCHPLKQQAILKATSE